MGTAQETVDYRLLAMKMARAEGCRCWLKIVSNLS